ncbi:MAG: hypothetical protein H0T53_12835 [Herpetosiphonaceae bacterium]|nr:hypothetical protein [Herpetosiphonaceae bacterium]
MSQLKASSRPSVSMIVMGIVLIGIAAFVLYAPFEATLMVQALLPLVLGIIIVLIEVTTKTMLLLIAGSLLSGLGIGFLLNATTFTDSASSIRLGVLLLSFAFGWFLVVIISKLFMHKTDWLSLIPGAIFAAFGGALVANMISSDHMTNLDRLFGLFRFWPAILVIAGLVIIFRQTRA